MRKRKIIYLIVMIIVAIGVGIGLYAITKKNNSGNNKNVETETNLLENINVIYTAHYGSIHSVYSGEGTITSNEAEYMDSYTLEYDNTYKPLLKVEAGQRIKAKQTLYEFDNKAYLSDSDGIVTKIYNQNNTLEIKVLNFDKQYIEFFIPYRLYGNIDYNSKVTIKEGDDEEIEGKITQLGYVVENDMVGIKIGFDKYIMPGINVKVSVDVGNTKEMLYLPVNAVYGMDADRYCYLYDEKAKSIERVSVTVGDVYTEFSDDTEFEYYEITSGLSDRDKVVELKQ